MRLTCPNCGAQYEVPDEVIPETGRDVQCSNCGDTWFQAHPDHAPAAGPEDAPDAPPAPEPEDHAAPEEAPEAEYDAALDADEDDDASSDTKAHDQPPAAEDADEAHAARADDPAPQHEAQRRELDPAIRDLLREEAEREQQARAADVGGLETQTEMGLDDSDDDMRTRQARERMARLRGEDAGTSDSESSGGVAPGATEPDTDGHADIDPSSRRNLLPDIDQINSSLDSDRAQRHDAAAAQDAAQAAPRKSAGFGRGFTLAVFLFCVLTLIYVFAPQIAELHPALQSAMETYVSTVNQLRVFLNETVASLMG